MTNLFELYYYKQHNLLL